MYVFDWFFTRYELASGKFIELNALHIAYGSTVWMFILVNCVFWVYLDMLSPRRAYARLRTPFFGLGVISVFFLCLTYLLACINHVNNLIPVTYKTSNYVLSTVQTGNAGVHGALSIPIKIEGLGEN